MLISIAEIGKNKATLNINTNPSTNQRSYKQNIHFNILMSCVLMNVKNTTSNCPHF